MEHFRSVDRRAKAFVSINNTMEYSFGDARAKVTMHVFGERGGRIRFYEQKPHAAMATANFACDGENYTLVNYSKKCRLAGACSPAAMRQLLHVDIAAKDFMLLAFGSTPMIPRPKARATWDGHGRKWVLELASTNGAWRQKLVLDGNAADGAKWELLRSTVWDSRGNIVWTLEHMGHTLTKAKDGSIFSLPTHTRFVQPQLNAQLVIDWGTRQFNASPMSRSRYTVSTKMRLRRCDSNTSMYRAAPHVLSSYNDPFGVDGRTRRPRPHTGLDFRAKLDTGVIAAASGVVELILRQPNSGGAVILYHPSSAIYTAYVHLDSIHVQRGMRVSRGDPLGEVGLFPDSGGIAHLHWEVCTDRLCGRHADPELSTLTCSEDWEVKNKYALTFPLACGVDGN